MSGSTHSQPNPLANLQEIFRIERKDIWTILSYGVGIGLMSLATPIAVQALVSTVAFGALLQPLVVLTLVLFASLSFSNLLVAIQYYVVEMLQRRVFVRFYGEAAQRVHRASAETHDEENVPEMVNRFFDVMTLQKTGSVLLLEGVGYLLQTLIGMILLAFYHPMLLAFDLVLVAFLAFVLFGMGRGGIATAIKQSKAKYAAVAWLEDIARNPNLFRSAGGPDFIIHRTDRLANAYLEASAAHFRVVMRQSIGALSLHTLASTLLLGMGGWMVIDLQLTLGQLVAAELVVSAMIYGFTRLGKSLDNFYEMMAGVDKLSHLLALHEERTGGTPLQTAEAGPMAVSLRSVSFHYPHSARLLERIDLDLAPGDRVALTGPSGSGKGTLMDLLYGLRVQDSGSILVDGHDLRNVDLDLLRCRVALVHRAEAIPATVLENLSLGRAHITIDEAFEALRGVDLLDEILALPQGINTQLNHLGHPLQSEQLVRMTLARAVIGQPRLLLLHEVLDYLDPHIAAGIVAHILRPDAPWTAVVSTQSPAVAAHCNRIYRLEEGRLRAVEPGHPEDIRRV